MATGRPDARAAAAALAIAAIAFVLRFNTLGGAFGGFDNDHFIYLLRTDALLAGEQPLRDFVDAELRGAWPALTYAASAWAQQLGGRTLSSEAYLTVGLLAIADALIFLLALDLSKRWPVALLAAALAIATFPKLYNYNKVLALVLGAWSARLLVATPEWTRLALAAVITAVAVLFRHDLGIYPAAAIVAALALRELPRWRAAVGHVALYAAFTTACLLPSVVWIQRYDGIGEYVRESAASVEVERARTTLRLPAFDPSSLFAHDNMELVSYLAFWAIAITGAAIAVGALITGRRDRADAALGAGLVVMTVLANTAFLRANLAERFGDAVAAPVLLAAWIVGTGSIWTRPALRRFVVAVPIALLVISLGAAYAYSEVGRELATSGLSESPRTVWRRYSSVRGELGRTPPSAWSDADAQGTLIAARYISECTAATDRVLTIGPVHEIPVYARRLFAAGQAMFKLSLYTSEAFQQRAVARLEAEAVPIALADEADFDEFASEYPVVAHYLSERFRDAGVIGVDGTPRFRVLVDTRRHATRRDARLGLPCFV